MKIAEAADGQKEGFQKVSNGGKCGWMTKHGYRSRMPDLLIQIRSSFLEHPIPDPDPVPEAEDLQFQIQIQGQP